MPRIEIIENHAKFTKGQVVDVDDIAASHATAFKYGKLYAGKPVEVQAVVQPETREAESIVDDIKRNKIPELNIFKRRGRKPRA